MKSFVVILGLSMSLSTLAQSWDNQNNPFRMNKNFISSFDKLPLDGEMEDKRKGWPGNHWPNYQGGIAHRWSSSDPQDFTFKRYSLEDLKSLEDYKLNELSPAEKFDILRGDFKYSTVTKVLKDLSPDENKWHGICHGEAPASLNHPEPDLVRIKTKDGIPLTFYSSDVEGLMSYYYAKVTRSAVSLIGSRCNSESAIPMPCMDINPGSFHIIMANKLGLEKVGFIADTERYSEVWNHVAINFTSKKISEEQPVETSSPKSVKRIRIESSVTYAAEIAPKFFPVIGTADATYFNTSYEYYLDLDKNGKIVGGEWLSPRRPDFVWTQKKASFTGIWSLINKVYTPIP